jgi:hypothetical protein
MLEFAWSEQRRHGATIRAAIEGVCRTFEASPVDSGALIRRLLEREHLVAYGFDELPTLTGELGRLLPLDPALVEQVYRAALSYRETDNSETQIGDGPLMRLRSNRRQDYGLATHNLAEFFPRFMEVAPVEATGAVIAAVEAEVEKHATVPMESIVGEAFQFGEVEARFAQDLSVIWGASHHRHDAHLQVLDDFEEGLVCLAGPGRDLTLLSRVLDRIIRENKFAALWRKVLSAAVREPKTLGPRVWPLVVALPVLTSSDTLELAGRYLQAVYPFLGQAERETIEHAILSIQAPDSQRADLFIRKRNRLLGCLSPEHIVTAEANMQIQELSVQGGPPPNSPLFKMGEMESQEFTEAQWLEEEGADMGAEVNRRLHEVCDTVTKYERQFANQPPTREQAEAVLLPIRELHTLLTEAGGAHPRVIETGWTHLAEACSTLARAEWLGGEPTTSALVRAILVEGSRHEMPRPDQEQEDHFEQHGAVGPSPRWEATRGLLALVRFPAFADAELVDVIRQLSQDPCREVRAEVALLKPSVGGAYNGV